MGHNSRVREFVPFILSCRLETIFDMYLLDRRWPTIKSTECYVSSNNLIHSRRRNSAKKSTGHPSTHLSQQLLSLY